jgi:hypothetical protein
MPPIMEAADRLVPGIMANIAKTNGYFFLTVISSSLMLVFLKVIINK